MVRVFIIALYTTLALVASGCDQSDAEPISYTGSYAAPAPRTVVGFTDAGAVVPCTPDGGPSNDAGTLVHCDFIAADGGVK